MRRGSNAALSAEVLNFFGNTHEDTETGETLKMIFKDPSFRHHVSKTTGLLPEAGAAPSSWEWKRLGPEKTSVSISLGGVTEAQTETLCQGAWSMHKAPSLVMEKINDQK